MKRICWFSIQKVKKNLPLKGNLFMETRHLQNKWHTMVRGDQIKVVTKGENMCLEYQGVRNALKVVYQHKKPSFLVNFVG